MKEGARRQNLHKLDTEVIELPDQVRDISTSSEMHTASNFAVHRLPSRRTCNNGEVLLTSHSAGSGDNS